MQWSGKTGGTPWMQRALVGIFRHTDVRIIYGVMSVWLVWYLIVRLSATRAVYRFHRRHRLRSIWAACIDTYRSYYNFGEAIMDRFAAFAGQDFRIEVEGGAVCEPLMLQDEGLIMLFSHVGNSEMAGYCLHMPHKRMNVLAYMAETETVTQNRVEALAKNNLRMIPIYANSMSHVYAVGEALSNGEIVAMAADRMTDNNHIACRFWGEEAYLPAGPFRLCVAAKKAMLLVFVLKTRWDTYRVHAEELHIPDGCHSRAEQAAALAQVYAERLEAMAKRYPYQWFNFYDFWDKTCI